MKYLIAGFTTLVVGLNSQVNPSMIPKSIASPSAQIIVVSTSTPTPSSSPSSSLKPSITYSGPSQRALKVAAYMYAHLGKEQLEDLRNQHGVIPSNREQEITDTAIWFDSHPNTLASDESLMNDGINAVKAPQVINNSQRYPRNCTSSTIGSYTYTNCY